MRNSDFSGATALTPDELSAITVTPTLKLNDTLIPTDKVYKREFTKDGVLIPYFVIRVTRERISADGIVSRRDILLPLRWFVNPSHNSALDVIEDIQGKRFTYEGWPQTCPEGEHRKPILFAGFNKKRES